MTIKEENNLLKIYAIVWSPSDCLSGAVKNDKKRIIAYCSSLKSATSLVTDLNQSKSINGTYLVSTNCE